MLCPSVAPRLQGLCLRRPQTTRSGAFGRKGWFGEKDVITTVLHLSHPLGVCFSSLPLAYILLDFVVNPKMR